MHEYDREIFKVLSEAGEQGLKTEKIAHHVFNACNSIFNPNKDEQSFISFLNIFGNFKLISGFNSWSDIV